jgi:hypothetical protein
VNAKAFAACAQGKKQQARAKNKKHQRTSAFNRSLAYLHPPPDRKSRYTNFNSEISKFIIVPLGKSDRSACFKIMTGHR